ncbi:MAG: alpha/beta hydrolase [Myxococcota bacterium]
MTLVPPEFVETAQGRFAVLSVGDAEAPLVLCAHGFPDHPPSFGPLLCRLADAGYRAVAPWMRGYRPSVHHGPYHADQLAADLLAIADALGADERTAIVGHDWGAVATYAALQRAPQRFRRAVTMAVPHPAAFLGAVPRRPKQLVRSWYMMFFQLPRVPERALARRDHALIRRLWRDWSPGYALPDDRWQALRDCLAESMPAPIEYYRAITRPAAEALARTRRQFDDGTIHTPTLYLHGADDGCIAPELAHEQGQFFAAEYQPIVLPGVGHFLQLEAPDLVADHVLKWLGPARSG